MNILFQIKNYLDNLKSKTKTVYRYSSKEEVEAFKRKDSENLGRMYNNGSLSNTHKYKYGEKYLHFFDKKDIPPHVIGSLPDNKKYLCTFEIPQTILKSHSGKGTYNSTGYDVYVENFKEYAIPMSKFDVEWFVDSTPIKETSDNIDDDLNQIDFNNKDFDNDTSDNLNSDFSNNIDNTTM